MVKKRIKEVKKVKRTGSQNLIGLILWITGILVSLAVGFGMIDGTLGVRFIPEVVTAIAGWIVVVLTLLGLLLAILEYFSR